MSDEPAKWRLSTSDIVYDGIQFDVRRDEMIAPDDTSKEIDYVDDIESVVILPFTREGDIITIREWRHPVGRNTLSLPGGEVEPEDDTLDSAAERELREETGFEAARLDHLASVEPASGIISGTDHYFVAHGCRKSQEQELEATESIDVTRYSESKLRAQVEAQNVTDAKLPLALFYFGNKDGHE